MNSSSKNKKLDSEKVENFWKWFAVNEHIIREVLDDDFHPDKNFIVQSLDNHILEFGMFTWEIGPSQNNSSDKPFYLIISPNGDKELLSISKSVVKLAPELNDWQFYSSKQVKNADLNFSIYDDNMHERHFDAAEWNFVLSHLPNLETKVILEAKNISHLDSDTKITAAHLALTAILGEEKKINSVAEILIVSEFEEEHRSKSKSIDLLAQSF
jgi:hypothetical protein